MIGGISFSATSTATGLDIDKPANPSPGNQYLATDTKKQYNCYVAGAWSDNSKVSSGVLSARPSKPVVGDIFVCTPDSTIYYCYLNNVWSQISTVNNIQLVGVANTNKLVVSVDNNYSLHNYWQPAFSITVPMSITKANIRVTWEAGYDGQGRDIESKLILNTTTQLGPVRYTANNWTTYYEDVTVYGGDEIILWGRYTDNLNTGGNVRNLRAYTELKYRHTLKPLGSNWIFDVDSV